MSKRKNKRVKPKALGKSLPGSVVFRRAPDPQLPAATDEAAQLEHLRAILRER